MSSIAHISDLLEQVLGEQAIELARETGFIQRQRNFDGADFAQGLILGWLQEPDARLDGLVQMLQRRQVSITASGLSQRFSPEAATFLRCLLERLSALKLSVEAVQVPLLRRESAVMVEDSSVITLPTELAHTWAGCGGDSKHSAAALKLFVRWDVLGGQLQGPRLAAGRHNDNQSPFNQEEVPVGGLYLADLGFFNQQRLARLARRQPEGKRFFVMRLQYGTRLYTRSGHQYQLRALLPQQVGEARELGVLLGRDARLPVRLILVRVPPEVAEQRREHLRQVALAHGREPGEEVLYLADWTLLVTNVPRARLSLPEALVLLRLRWQIEIVQSQLTKKNPLAGGGSGDHIADLHLLIGDHDAVNEQFNQLSFLLKSRLSQAELDTLTKRLNGLDLSRQFIMAPDAGFELTDLLSNSLQSMLQLLVPTLVLLQLEDTSQIGVRESLHLML